jgi:hypothetical protein
MTTKKAALRLDFLDDDLVRNAVETIVEEGVGSIAGRAAALTAGGSERKRGMAISRASCRQRVAEAQDRIASHRAARTT